MIILGLAGTQEAYRPILAQTLGLYIVPSIVHKILHMTCSSDDQYSETCLNDHLRTAAAFLLRPLVAGPERYAIVLYGRLRVYRDYLPNVDSDHVWTTRQALCCGNLTANSDHARQEVHNDFQEGFSAAVFV